ncbi:hypothetical protein DEVEQU_03864 [Devosia equisanguinis]|uniref:Uncharacterized protein n=1 Tax=Devosia equisanguinis TaxID=2490941 RepID=A0A447IGT2_9HYPH|nr:hypothetical protein [Devosia equisanguinis]VDS06699.1 hypothetical protein DEVEQU_03864 [Devosia equisanguinis]
MSEGIVSPDELDRDGRPIAWDAVRRDYEAGYLTCNTIARLHRLRRLQLDNHARKNKWDRAASMVLDRHILIQKLMALLERQMDILEDGMASGEKVESKVLSDLVRDLDKLIGIEKAEGQRSGHDGETGEMRDLQRKLEARINALTKAKTTTG